MRTTSLLVCLAALAVAGCGDDKKKDSGGDSAQATQQDATAKSDARNLVTTVESCYVDSQDYGQCKETAGVAKVTAAAPATYTVEAKSKSGNTFTLEKAEDGTLKRTCTGEGGCNGGTW